MCSLQLPESWDEAYTTFCELGIGRTFQNILLRPSRAEFGGTGISTSGLHCRYRRSAPCVEPRYLKIPLHFLRANCYTKKLWLAEAG